jgi:squalene synthase HpnC
VALRLLPGRLRRDLMALYGFARLADQAGDAYPGEGGDRLRVLDALEDDLGRAFSGTARHPLLRDLTPVLQRRELPREPFARLIEANRRDQQVTRYATWAELLDYCTLSANPVGELVLHLAGAATPERLAWSDAVCTALQVIEHSQDVLEDCEAGRVYLPGELLAAEGCPEADLVKAPASPALRRVLARLAGRARALLRSGDPLVPSLRGPARLAVAGFVAGGHAALDALEAAGFDVTSATVGPARGRVARRAVSAWAGRASR